VSSVAGAAGSVNGVELGDSTVVAAYVIVVCNGSVPRMQLVDEGSLVVVGGVVVVEESCDAFDGRTVAAGDCTLMPNPYPLGVGGRVRLESVNNALEQAKVAAASLLGREVSYTTVPWFWSDQADLKLQIAGLSTGYDSVVVRGEPDP